MCAVADGGGRVLKKKNVGSTGIYCLKKYNREQGDYRWII
jgi:hypothetical protein